MPNDAEHYLRILNEAINSHEQKGTRYSKLHNDFECVGENAGSHTKGADVKYLLDKSAELNRILAGVDTLQQTRYDPSKWGQSPVSNELKNLARKIEIKQSQLHEEIADKLK